MIFEFQRILGPKQYSELSRNDGQSPQRGSAGLLETSSVARSLRKTENSFIGRADIADVKRTSFARTRNRSDDLREQGRRDLNPRPIA